MPIAFSDREEAMKRLGVASVVLLALGVAIAFAVPASRYRILSILKDEPLYNGRPTEYWMAALNDDDAAVRREAAVTLGEAEIRSACAKDESQTQSIVAALAQTLGDKDGFVRKGAATSLLTYPRETPIPEGRSTIAVLIAALTDNEAAVRKAAARSLWQAGKAAAQDTGIPRLTAALGDKDDFVREYAARTLGRIGPDAKTAVPALLERLLKDEERDVREHAAMALGLIGAKAIGPLLPDTVRALIAGLDDEAADVRENSARSLGQLGATVAIPDLREMEGDSQPRVRAAVAEALKQLELMRNQK
jgi:HEAT repeat protein